MRKPSYHHHNTTCMMVMSDTAKEQRVWEMGENVMARQLDRQIQVGIIGLEVRAFLEQLFAFSMKIYDRFRVATRTPVPLFFFRLVSDYQDRRDKNCSIIVTRSASRGGKTDDDYKTRIWRGTVRRARTSDTNSSAKCNCTVCCYGVRKPRWSSNS